MEAKIRYRTRSNYLNILIARMAYLIYPFLPNSLNMLNFEFSYPFYLTERTHHAVYTSIKAWQELEKTTRIHTSLAVKGDARMSEGTGQYQLLSCLYCLHNILIRSNYTRTSHVQDIFAFYLRPNDRINKYFLPFG